jgi:hypothetical protein
LIEFSFLLLAPFFVDLLLVFLIASAETRFRLFACAVIYILCNIVGALVFGYFYIEGVREDLSEFLSLGVLVLFTRIIDLYAFKGLKLFRDALRNININKV